MLRISLLVAGMFGHGGVATWMVLTTAALWISKRGRETAAMLLNLIIILPAYAIYTSLLYALSNAYNSVVEAVLALGEKNSCRDTYHLSSANLIAGQLLLVFYTRKRACQGSCLFLRDVSCHRLYRRFGISSGRFATVPRLAVGGYVGCIRSSCFRVASKETVWRSLLCATCSRRRIFFRLFRRICTAEPIY